jgi:uncharacterized protein YbjT (DUF2867 family)
MRIAVAGGTGWAGRLVVEAARARGHTPVVLARSAGVDLVSGAGLDGALDGVDVVVDVTNRNTTSRARAVAFFGTVTANLLRAGEKAGVSHHIALSVVGCDRVKLGYYGGKLRQEELVLGGAVPATVLRATQFHEFAAQLLDHAAGPFVAVPRMVSRPVAAREVAAVLIETAEGGPAGRAPELAGPEELRMVAMTRRLVRARGLRKVVVPIPLAGALTHGGLLPTVDGPRGTETFGEWVLAR